MLLPWAQEQNNQNILELRETIQEMNESFNKQHEFNDEVKRLLQFLVSTNPKPSALNSINNSAKSTPKAPKSLTQTLEQ